MMTPLRLRAAAGPGAHLVSRPRGVLHAYRGPLTPSGRWVPRAGRTACHARTRTLGVVALPAVQSRLVCGRCAARLAATPACEPGSLHRADAKALFSDVTPFDLAVDAWRAESPADVEHLEWLVLLVVGYPGCAKTSVVAPNGKVTDPIDKHLARARRRLGIVRDPMAPAHRAAAVENRAAADDVVKQRKAAGWREREDRIGRLGFVNATTR